MSKFLRLWYLLLMRETKPQNDTAVQSMRGSRKFCLRGSISEALEGFLAKNLKGFGIFLYIFKGIRDTDQF